MRGESLEALPDEAWNDAVVGTIQYIEIYESGSFDQAHRVVRSVNVTL